ncbi:lipopolysaccharide biosynthesis protein [Thermodesulfovibrio yellowstonii]|nr:oligosaccharide flippase family protein [Thermodesulfovibrio yellowstonii]
MVPVTTYYLEPKDFGIFAIINTIVMPIGPLSSTGVSWVLGGNYYKINEEERKILLFNLLILDFTFKFFWVIVFWLLSYLLLPVIIKDFEHRYILYFKLILLATLFTALWPTISYFIVLQQKGRLHAIFEIIPWLCGAITTIVSLSVFNFSTLALFLNPLVSGLTSFLLGLWYIKNYIKPIIVKKWLTEIFKVGIPSILVNLVDILTSVLSRYFIQKWINLSQLGIYSHSESYKTIFTMGTKAFSRSFVPPLLEAFSKNTSTEKIETQLKRWYGLLGLAGVFVTLFSYEIVNILTHGKFVKAAPLVPIWFFLILSFTYGMPGTQFLLVQKKNQFMMYSGIITGMIFISVIAFSVYQFGLFGAVISLVLYNFCIQLVRTIYAKKLGSRNLGEKYFALVTVLMFGVYLLNELFKLSFIGKILVLILLYVYIFKQFGLNEMIYKKQKIFFIILANKNEKK